ncbi:MAG: hypothetical protein WA991_14295 [Ornithinimicrobium sp.]
MATTGNARGANSVLLFLSGSFAATSGLRFLLGDDRVSLGLGAVFLVIFVVLLFQRRHFRSKNEATDA